MTTNMMIATILDRQPRTVKERIAIWRQLSDILAQRGMQLQAVDAHRALRALASFRSDVPEYIRRDSALSVARHGRFAPLIALYANDVAPVAVAMLQHCRLAKEDWLLLLPSIGNMGRFILAGRDDLPAVVQRALASLGPAAIALPPPRTENGAATAWGRDAATAAPPTAPFTTARQKKPSSQISELVRRIDRFQAARSATGTAPPKQEDVEASNAGASPAQSPPSATMTQFRFESSADGVIDWADAMFPHMIIGLSLAEPAIGDAPGCDARVAHAIGQHAEIVGAPIDLIGPMAMAGQWDIFAEPVFAPLTGQFEGYRGIARRPMGGKASSGVIDSPDSGDEVRQLTHELRSPLNAISGFAQIISGQMFGPAEPAYRDMADHIVTDAQKIQAIIDDLDASNGKAEDRGHNTENFRAVDMADICARVHQDVQGLAADQRVRLSINADGGPFWVRSDEDKTRRMVGRLITSLIEISEPGDLLVARLTADLTGDDMVQLRIILPAAIRFLDMEQLLNPGAGQGADHVHPKADVLGLSFALRLISSLAAAEHGRLDITANALILHLPLATANG